MLRAACVLVLVTAMASGAVADDDNKAKALALFDESDQAYKAGEFEKSADLLRQAYALYPEPILLYNLARALEGLGDTKGALEQYERYLADAKDVKDRGAIERRVATMKQQLEAEAERRRLEQNRIVREPGPRHPPPPPPETHASKAPYVVIALGAAAVGTGVVFGRLAASKHDAAVAEPSQQAAQQLQDTAQSYATIGNVT